MAGRPPKKLQDYPNRIREQREARALTLEQLAEMSGLSVQSLQRFEVGERELKVWQLEKVAKALGIRPQLLLRSVDPTLDEQEAALLAIFARLPAGDRTRIVRMAAALLPEETEPLPGRVAS